MSLPFQHVDKPVPVASQFVVDQGQHKLLPPGNPPQYDPFTYRRSEISAAIDEEAGELDESCPQQGVSTAIVDVPPLTNVDLDLTPGSTQDQMPDWEEGRHQRAN